MGNKSITARF